MKRAENLAPPPFDGVVRDLATCELWLAEAHFGEPLAACGELRTLLETLERTRPPHGDHAAVVERVRRRMLVALEEGGKRFTGRAVPLREYEAAAFEVVTDLWSRYADAMARLADTAPAEAPGAQAAGALPRLVGRAIEGLTGLARAHFQARREVTPDLWRRLHALFSLAESRGILDAPIQPDNSASATCRELYVRLALAFVAMPYNLSTRELDWTLRWIWRWAHKVQIVTTHERESSFGVDLAVAEPPRWMKGVRGPAIRQFDLSELRRSVRKRQKALEAGASPRDLGLGQDITAAEAGALLAQLHVRWFETPVARHAARHAGANEHAFVVTLEEIYNALGGLRPIGPKDLWARASVAGDRQIFALGRPNEQTTACVFPPREERWEQLDFSTTGVRMRRLAAGERIAFRQLAAVCESAARGFVLCEVRWITEGADQALTAALQFMPGAPRPVGVRATDAGGTSVFQAAIVLPQAAGEPSSIVLPHGQFKPDGVLDLHDGGAYDQIRLAQLVARGADFERYRFEHIGSSAPS